MIEIKNNVINKEQYKDRKIKIAAVGSCVSRDPFNSLFNEDWKDYFEFTAYQFQGSAISLMSPGVAYDAVDFEWTNTAPKATKWALYSELNKAFLSDLYHAQPDYLIIDLYSDVFYGMCEMSNTWMMNKGRYINRNPLLKKNKGKEYGVEFNKKEFIPLFEEKIDAFMAFCQEYIPETKIVINRARFKYKYVDEKGKKHWILRYPKIRLKYLNRCWRELENYILKNYDVLSLNHNNKIYYAAETHPFGDKFPLHYTKDFYTDFKYKLLKLVKKNGLADGKVKECYNLIQNHDFSLKTASWQGFQHKEFNVFDDGILDVCATGNDENIYHSLSSYPILIRRGETYRFSFEFTPIDLSDMKDSDPICYIRTYNQPEKVMQKWASYYRKITKKEVLDYLEEHQTNRFELTLTLNEGKFVKILPYVLKNGHYQFKNMMCYLEMGQEPHQYTINETLLNH